MRKKHLPGFLTLSILICICGCEDFGTGPEPQQDYAKQVSEAQGLIDRVEKLYHEATGLELGPERTSKLKEAYRLADRAMVILNKLDDQFGGREVPPGEVLAHKPLMRKLSRLLSDIVKIMPVG